jgi:hypothetical protein
MTPLDLRSDGTLTGDAADRLFRQQHGDPAAHFRALTPADAAAWVARHAEPGRAFDGADLAAWLAREQARPLGTPRIHRATIKAADALLRVMVRDRLAVERANGWFVLAG